MKPSEHSPATSALFAELIPKYLDPELYHVINGAIPETTKVRGWSRWADRRLSDTVSPTGA